MKELSNTDLKLLFTEDLYLIKEKAPIEPTETKETLPTANAPKETSLVVEEPKIELSSFAYKGGNEKGIIILVNDDTNEFLNETDEALLLNILKAIGLALKDVAIINQHNSGTKWQSQIDFTKAIAFGILPSAYGITTDHYSIIKKEDAQWLFSDSLFALANDKVLKGKLWGKLQEIF